MKVSRSTKLVPVNEPKNSRHCSFWSGVRLAGCTFALPVMWKVANGKRKPTLSCQSAASMLSSHVQPEPAGECMYSASSQSASFPEVTPPAKSHQPQKPKPTPVPGNVKLNKGTDAAVDECFEPGKFALASDDLRDSRHTLTMSRRRAAGKVPRNPPFGVGRSAHYRRQRVGDRETRRLCRRSPGKLG